MEFNSGFKGLMKICSVEADFFHADGTDGQTDSHPDVTKLIVAFTILRTRLKAAKYSNV
jgi:hypothetical protein